MGRRGQSCSVELGIILLLALCVVSCPWKGRVVRVKPFPARKSLEHQGRKAHLSGGETEARGGIQPPEAARALGRGVLGSDPNSAMHQLRDLGWLRSLSPSLGFFTCRKCGASPPGQR